MSVEREAVLEPVDQDDEGLVHLALPPYPPDRALCGAPLRGVEVPDARPDEQCVVCLDLATGLL